MSAESGRKQGRNAQKEVLKRAPPAAPHSQSMAVHPVAVLGVVYGDIGTSPIYALRECFAGKNPILVTTDNVLGVLSIIFRTLILVISLKYMVYVLRADNRGEGGTFALLALLRPDRDQQRLSRRALILLGLLGASMLYGGVMITPAISVLSAVEGLQMAAPHLHAAVFFTGRSEQTPPSLQQLVERTHVLYKRVVLLTVVIEPVPRINADERIEMKGLGEGFYRLVLRYGFMQGPNIPSELDACAKLGLKLDLDKIHYIVGHVTLLAGRKLRGMALWRDRLFVLLTRNTQDATAFYQLPVAQTLTVGMQVGI